jgi:soluble P-type ATPase
MITIDVPGFRHLRLTDLVLDYNGTLAENGRLIAGVGEALKALADRLDIHVLTADTFGQAGSETAGLPCRVTVLPAGKQAAGKRDFVRNLGADRTVCIGNGRNDRFMLGEAALGIAVVLGEGAASEALAAADVVCTDILHALDLLRHPLRLVATLRS